MSAVAHYWHKYRQYDHECESLEAAIELIGGLCEEGLCAPIGVTVDDGPMRPWSEFEDAWWQSWRERL